MRTADAPVIYLAAALVLGVAMAGSAPKEGEAQDGSAVDLELVLAVDSSGSIDDDEAQLQRGGWAGAFTHPRVLGAIRSGTRGAIAVTFLEWAATGCQTLSVGWTRISDAVSAQAFANAIIDAPRVVCPGGNAIGDAVAMATQELHTNAYRGERLVIDVSGDGPNTLGRPVEPARGAAVAAGITINALALLRRQAFYGPIDEYYRRSVIGGPGAFVLAADKETEFRQAVLAKLVREIAGTTSGPQDATRAAKAERSPASRRH